jgi:uncharacterized protein YqeY
MDPAAIEAAVNEAIQSANATGIKDMGNVMAMLKARHGAQLDMSVAGPIVKTRLQAL